MDVVKTRKKRKKIFYRIHFLVQVLIIFNQFRSYCLHNENDLVSFNDVRARIKFVDNSSVQYFGTSETLKVNSTVEGLGYLATFIDLDTGCGIFQNPTQAYLGEKCLQKVEPLPIELIYGPMGSDGFWGLENIGEIVGQDRSFTLIQTFLIKSSLVNETEIKYNIMKGSKWKFLQIFEWKTDIFVSFETSNRTVVTLRLKTHSESSTAYGTFISSFMVDAVANTSVYFIPSYPEPTMYVSQENQKYSSLKLSDVIKKSDEGFQECQESGKYPSDFLKLAPYVYNLSKQSWSEGDQGQCQYNISLFKMDKLPQCTGFTIADDVLPGSVETYWVSFEFNLKILAHLQAIPDQILEFSCDLTRCETDVQLNCKGRKSKRRFQTKILSTSWNPDDFVLVRWTRNGSREVSRLLNCWHYNTCGLCTIYGGFDCLWSSWQCMDKEKVSGGKGDPCYSGVPTLKRFISDTEIELEINLPYKLNRQLGESVSVTLSGKEYSDVVFTGNVYVLKTALMNYTRPFISIKRGINWMNSSLSISLAGTEGIGSTLLLILAFLVISTISFVAGIWVERKGGKNLFKKEPEFRDGMRFSGPSDPTIPMTQSTSCLKSGRTTDVPPAPGTPLPPRSITP